MATNVLTDAQIYVGAYDFTGVTNNVNLEYGAEPLDATNFGSGGTRTFKGGLKTIAASASGFWEAGTGTVGEASFTNTGADDIVVTLGYQQAVGSRAFLFAANQPKYATFDEVGQLAPYSIDLTARGSVLGQGVILLPVTASALSAVATNGTAVDNSASSANGGAAHLHVTATTGGSATIKVQHSTDNSSWSDLVTFTAVTAATSQRSTVAGTVNRYLRYTAVLASGTQTVTFGVAFARL